jgi:hypothetical protein
VGEPGDATSGKPGVAVLGGDRSILVGQLRIGHRDDDAPLLARGQR